MVYKLLIVLFITFSNLFAVEELENIKTFEAYFEQIVENSSSNKIIYKGHVFIKNDGKVLWQYLTPIKKNVYLLRDIVVIDEPELEQVIYSRLKQEINILNILKNSKKENKQMYSSKIDDRTYFIKTLEGKIISLRFKDELENSILIKFSSVKQNENLKDEIFRFIPPDYYDIIKK